MSGSQPGQDRPTELSGEEVDRAVVVPEGAAAAGLRNPSSTIIVPETCPNCGASRGGRFGVHWHNVSVWCLNCGWGRNHDGSER
jgi:hypothetical protein